MELSHQGLERPLGLQEVEASRISRQSAYDGCKVESPTRRPPLHQEIFDVCSCPFSAVEVTLSFSLSLSSCMPSVVPAFLFATRSVPGFTSRVGGCLGSRVLVASRGHFVIQGLPRFRFQKKFC